MAEEIEFDSFMGNMSDEEKLAWRAMSPEERIKVARKKQIEKRRAAAAAQAAKVAEAKEFHRKSREYSGTDKFRLFPELRGDSDATPELQVTDYRGQKGTPESLSNIPPVTDTDTGEGEYSLATSPEGQAAKALADEKLGLSEGAISVMPGLESAVDSSKESAESEVPWWKKLGLSRGLDHATAEIAKDNRIIDKAEIQEHQGTDLAVKLQMEEEAARKKAVQEAKQAELEKFTAPRTQAFKPAVLDRLQKYIKNKDVESKEAEQDVFGASREEEFESSDEEKHKLELKEQLALMQKSREENIAEQEKKDNDRLGLINLNKEDNKDATTALKKKVTKEAVAPKKGDKSVTDDFVRFDDRGFPIYKKMSKWAKSFNTRFALAQRKGEGTFKWTGHDGIEREYTAKEAVETAKEAPSIDTKDSSVITDTPNPHLQEGVDVDPAKVRENNYFKAYKSAKTSDAREDAIKKAEEEGTTDKEKKDTRAAFKEQAEGPDRYWIDPRTGYALNLSRIARRVKRKDEMEMAALFPPADRAAYLFSKKMIDSEDFDAIMKNPNQKRELDFKLKNLQIKEAQLKVVAQKRKNEQHPQRKEWLKLYENAVTNDDYEMQILLGKKLGFDDDILKLSTDGRRKFEQNKLAGKGMNDKFKSTFHTPYTNVINKHDNWIKRASSIIQTTGMIDAIGLDGKKYVDRRGYFRSFGLFEQADMLKQPNKGALIEGLPYYERIKTDEAFAGSDGKFDPIKFIKNTVAYEKHLLDSLVYMGMDKSYSGQWPRMISFITGVQQPSLIDGILSNQPPASTEGEGKTSWGL